MDHVDDEPYIPPRHTIDLSLRPRDRYRALAAAYKDKVQNLTGLFNELLLDLSLPQSWLPMMNHLSRLLLRHVHDNVQTEELRGVSLESGVPMYLLVAFNVILDLLMGCTSGGVRSLEKGRPLSEAKMLHFRTLDWGMDPLRKVIVQLDFVKSDSEQPNKILASTITYVGFVGVLTGVRERLSMSLNFRAVHDAATRTAHFRFYLHHVLVLLGRRPSIASTLRHYLIGHTTKDGITSRPKRSCLLDHRHRPMYLEEVIRHLQAQHTTAAYLIFSNGNSTVSIDKDFGTAKTRVSESFIATTNHDVPSAGKSEAALGASVVAANVAPNAARKVAGLEELLDESKDRLECITKKWNSKVRRGRSQRKRNGEEMTFEEVEAMTALTKDRVVEWVSAWPTTNETTHFAAVMDPSEGKFVWSMAYPEPLVPQI